MQIGRMNRQEHGQENCPNAIPPQATEYRVRSLPHGGVHAFHRSQAQRPSLQAQGGLPTATLELGHVQ